MLVKSIYLADVETPVSLFHKLSQDEPIAFLLESNEDDTRLARYSFIGIAPRQSILFQAGQAMLKDHQVGSQTFGPISNPLDSLKAMLDQACLELEGLNENGFPFTGGLVGYMGYGATQYFENIPRQTTDPFDVPDGYYGLYDTVIMFDHLYRRIFILSHQSDEQAQATVARIESKLNTACPLPPLSFDINDIPDEAIFDNIEGPFTQEQFCEAVLKTKQHIYEGQAFQIVLAQRFSQPITAPPMHVYRMIRAINPSPYTYFLKFPDFTYLGASPERFARCHNNELDIRVLAGTRPRGLTEEADHRLEEELLADEKEMAEHRMLVDLGRNDLGRIAEAGSIAIGDIATLTRYTHVMHLSTRLTGTLREDKSAFDTFQSCFPRGTVSGAPKIRAMQLLSDLEPEQRGIYSGAVGYFDYHGNMDSAIAIRSVLIKDNMAHVNAGAGVVYDSNPESEYQETRNKAKSILKAIKLAERLADA